MLRRSALRWRQVSTVEQIRRVFGALAILTVLVQVPALLAVRQPPVPLAVSLPSATVLVAGWLAGMAVRRFPLGTAVIESAAAAGLGLGTRNAHMILPTLYAMVLFRSLYGSHRAAAGRVAAYSVALAVVFTWNVERAVLEPYFPISLAVMTATMRILAYCLERLAQANELSASLARTAGELLTAVTVDDVRGRCAQGARKIAPGAEVRVVFADDEDGPAATDGAVRFSLGSPDGPDGAILIWPARPLRQSQYTALRTMAAQASSALESLGLRRQLSYRASHDGLTDLPNRTSYTDSLAAALRSGVRCGALFIDLDDFKSVNDTFGHLAGDLLLRKVADRVRGCLRAGDVAARVGGDEFAILVQGTDDVLDTATAIAVRTLAVLDEPFDLGGTPCCIRCSIGVAVGRCVTPAGGSATGDGVPFAAADEVDDAMSALLRDADIAMYVAKSRGKNRYEVFAPEMARVVAHHLGVRQELAAALCRDEFELRLQPIVALPSPEVARPGAQFDVTAD